MQLSDPKDLVPVLRGDLYGPLLWGKVPFLVTCQHIFFFFFSKNVLSPKSSTVRGRVRLPLKVVLLYRQQHTFFGMGIEFSGCLLVKNGLLKPPKRDLLESNFADAYNGKKAKNGHNCDDTAAQTGTGARGGGAAGRRLGCCSANAPRRLLRWEVRWFAQVVTIQECHDAPLNMETVCISHVALPLLYFGGK